MNRKPTRPPQYPSGPPPPPSPPPGYPVQRIEYFQPVRVPVRRRNPSPGNCLTSGFGLALQAGLFAALLALALLAAYLLAPIRTNLLVLGIDRAPEGTSLGRSDTMILLSIVPLKPTVAMLSIPRDLWVSVPGYGENRINTAHFYAEADQAGAGPAAAVQTVEQNFGVPVHAFVRLRFDAFTSIVDALGGVTLTLSEDMGGLPAGTHHLDGPRALAFVRDRKGTDDFFRMERAQLMLRAVAREILYPISWPRLPAVAVAVFSSVDTNLPFWQWPRMGLALLRAAAGGSIDSYAISRDMVTPYTTDQGASVLLPNWPAIQSLVGDWMH